MIYVRERVLPMFSSMSFIDSGITFRSLIHFEFTFVYDVRKCYSSPFSTGSWPIFPAPLVKEIVFSPLYILASFVKDKVSIGSWIYLWAFYPVPLIYISVFVPVSYCLDDCGFVVETEVWQVDSSSSILLSQDWFGYSRIFCISMQTVKLFVLVLWKIPLVAW